MKKVLFTMMLTAMAMTATAQNEKEEAQIHDEKKDSVTQAAELNTTMSEVTVKAARTVQKVDGTWIFPTRRQLESSPNGYSLLAKLALPHIRVDEALSSITALSSIGGVQVRINAPLPEGKHLGIIIGAFKGGVSRAWWRLMEGAEAHATATVACGQAVATVSGASASEKRPSLFEPNYNDPHLHA